MEINIMSSIHGDKCVVTIQIHVFINATSCSHGDQGVEITPEINVLNYR